MSSTLQSALTSLQQNDYTTLVILTAVGYDYIFTFANEIEYIWSKQWTWVSILFILVRYCGLYIVIVSSLIGSTFLPGPAMVCKIMFIIDAWTFVLFIGAANLVMILRVWAMHNQSRLILTALLTLFALEIISAILASSIGSNVKNMSAVTGQILGFSFCAVQTTIPIWTQVAGILEITHGAAMCALATVQFIRQSIRMYGVTKRWQLNQYMNLFVKEGIIYFVALFVFTLANVLAVSGKFPAGGLQLMLMYIVEYVPIFTLSPRFIMSMRELYTRDARGRIDTAFGLSSSRGAAGTAIVFAEGGQSDVLEDFEGNADGCDGGGN